MKDYYGHRQCLGCGFSYLGTNNYCTRCSAKAFNDLHPSRNPPTPSEVPSEVMVGTLYGLRAFSQRGHFLMGSYGGKWYSPRQKARCRLQREVRESGGRYYRGPEPGRSAPCDNPGCRCGIYALSIDRPHVGATLRKLIPTDAIGALGSYGPFLAVTQLWGRVQVNTNGYRAGQARVVKLIRLERHPRYHANPLPQGWKDVPVVNYPGSLTMASVELVEQLSEFSSQLVSDPFGKEG